MMSVTFLAYGSFTKKAGMGPFLRDFEEFRTVWPGRAQCIVRRCVRPGLPVHWCYRFISVLGTCLLTASCGAGWPPRGETAPRLVVSMAQVNGHAGHNASEDNSLSTFLQGPSVDTSRGHSQPEGQTTTPEVTAREDSGAPRTGEWARVSSLAIKHLDRCVSLEPKVLQSDNPAAIHDLRIATRRLQQVIDLVYPSPHSGEIRKLYRGLKRCRTR